MNYRDSFSPDLGGTSLTFRRLLPEPFPLSFRPRELEKGDPEREAKQMLSFINEPTVIEALDEIREKFRSP